jgi:8-oxo-dGTP pyrophosphatase MutT (NUDIX family)
MGHVLGAPQLGPPTQIFCLPSLFTLCTSTVTVSRTILTTAAMHSNTYTSSIHSHLFEVVISLFVCLDMVQQLSAFVLKHYSNHSPGDLLNAWTTPAIIWLVFRFLNCVPSLVVGLGTMLRLGLSSLIQQHGPFWIWCLVDWYNPVCPRVFKLWRVRRDPLLPAWARHGFSKRQVAVLRQRGRGAHIANVMYLRLLCFYMDTYLVSPVVKLFSPITNFLQALFATVRGGGSPPRAVAGSTAVVGLLVTPFGMLLASRGPASKPSNIIGMLAGIGGKVEDLEAPEDALVREFMEEVSIDISPAQMIPLGVENYDGTRCAHYIIYLESEVTPNVPAAERSKVANPNFYPINALPYHDMIPELSALLQRNSDLLTLSLRLTGSNAIPPKWVERRLDLIPDDFSMFLVNNKDSSCLLYALAPQLPPNTLDFKTLEANMPSAGYSPLEVLTHEQLRRTAIWDCDIGMWSHGDPTTAEIFLSYVRNGDFGHYDMLKRLAPGEVTRDYILYPNGRGSFLTGRGGTADPEVADPEAESSASDDSSSVISSNSQDTFSLHDSHIDDKNRFNVHGFNAIAKYVRSKMITQETGKAAMSQTVERTYWGAAYTAVQGVAQRLNDYISFSSRSDIFTDIEYASGLTPTTATAQPGRVVAMLNNNVIGSAVKLTHNAAAMTAQLEIVVRIGHGISRVRHWFDLTARPQPPIPVLVDNMVPTQAPEKFIDLTRNISGLFNATLSNPPINNVRPADIANDISRAVWSLDDRTGGDLSYLYERIIAGMCAAELGASPRAVVVQQSFLRMFPTARSWAYIWGTVSPPAGDPAGCLRFKGPDGMSQITLLVLGSYQGIGDPRISEFRDYRVALHMVSQAYLGFNVNRAYSPQVGNRFAAVASYAAEMPYVTFLLPRTNTPVVRTPAEMLACATNPDSWKDALCFLLKNFGRASDFSAAMDQVTSDFTRHMSPNQTMLPVPISSRFQAGPRLLACLENRLVTMRALLPVYADTDPNEVKDFKKAMLARTITDNLSDGSVASLARIRTKYIAATTYDLFVPVSNAQIQGDTIDVDAEWHQFFAGIGTGSTSPEFQYMVDELTSGLTTQELNNLRLWLSDPEFTDRWLSIDAAARPQLRQGEEFFVPLGDRSTTNDDRRHLPEDMQSAHSAGYNMRRDQSLCTFDVQRARLVTVPCGIMALRAITHGMELYHSDTMALNINDTLHSCTPSDIIRRMFLASAVWRSCADASSETVGLTGSRLSLALGQFETGNVQLDTALNNVDGHSKSGGMQQLLDLYLTTLDHNLQACGYSVSDLLTARGSLVEWVNFDSFRYLNGVANDNVNLLFTATHHILSRVLAPNISRIGGIINKRLEWMGNQVNGDLVPWDSWVATTTDFSPTELLGALRIAVATVGMCLVAPASVYYKRRSTESLPRKYPVLQAYDHVPPRRSDCSPVTPYYAVDPYSLHLPVLGYTIDIDAEEGHPAFLDVFWQYSYLSMARTSERPPTIAYDLSNFSNVALPNTAGQQIIGYAAHANFQQRAEIFAGATSSVIHQMVTPDNTPSLDWLQYQPQAGLQMSGNWNVSRALEPMSRSLGISQQLDDRVKQHDGNAITDAPNARRMLVKAALTTGLWPGDSAPALNDYELFASTAPGITKRAEVWATKITLFQLPANHSPLVDVVPTQPLNSTPFLNEITSAKIDAMMAGRVAEDGDLPAIGNPAVPPKPDVFRIPGFVQQPDPYDGRHLLEGFRASKRLQSNVEPGCSSSTEVASIEKKLRAAKLEQTSLETKLAKLKKASENERKTGHKSGKTGLRRIAGSKGSVSDAGTSSSKVSISRSTLDALVRTQVESALKEAKTGVGSGAAKPGTSRYHGPKSNFR